MPDSPPTCPASVNVHGESFSCDMPVYAEFGITPGEVGVDVVERIVIPTAIKVGTVTYRVTTDRDEWIRFEHAQRKTDRLGYTDNDGAIILINPDCAPHVARQTLWHETLHALHFTVMGGPDWRGIGRSAHDREETVIASWEHPTLAVLRDNPNLVAYLTGQDV